MADLTEGFRDFIDRISLTDSKSDSLRLSRDANRERIDYSSEANNRKLPKFRMQGSFVIKTTINPLSDGEYDLDDGVYLEEYDKLADCPTPETVHKWIIDAVSGYTNGNPIDKNTCVRVPYSGGYHIDLPVYAVINEVNYLGHKVKGWIESDPKEFSDWFINESKAKPDLKDIVKCLKGWRDFRVVDLKSIVLSILASNCYQESISFQKTFKNTFYSIYQTLNSSFSCLNPNDSSEDLLSDYSQDNKDQILSSMKRFCEAVDYSVNEESESKASTKLKEYFGERFPIIPDKGRKEYEKHTPGVINGSGRSAG